jgi:hypothetical protein
MTGLSGVGLILEVKELRSWQRPKKLKINKFIFIMMLTPSAQEAALQGEGRAG